MFMIEAPVPDRPNIHSNSSPWLSSRSLTYGLPKGPTDGLNRNKSR
jgi:hypothetical protein